jgi:putative oxidoreductase
VLMVAFLVAQAQAWARGLSLDCGCFGALAQQKVGFWSIARDAALGIPGLVLALRPARYLSLDQRFLGLPDAFAPGPEA